MPDNYTPSITHPDRPSPTKIGSVTTSASGSTFVPLGNYDCQAVMLQNLTGTSIEVRRPDTSTTFVLPDQSAYPFEDISDASQLSLRRVDLSNTQVTLKYEAIRYV